MNSGEESAADGLQGVWIMIWVDVSLRLLLPNAKLAARLSALTGLRLSPDIARASHVDVAVDQGSSGRCLITVGASRYEVTNEADLGLRLLSLIGSLLLERTGQLIVHAGAIRCEKGALLFCGPSYVGKSTLGFRAWQAGLTLIGDDRLVFHAEEASVSAFPKPLKPRVSPIDTESEVPMLADQFMGRLEGEYHQVIARAVPGMMPLEGKVPVHRIFFLERSREAVSHLRRLTAKEALPRWLNQMMLSQSRAMLITLAPLERWTQTGDVYELRVGDRDTDRALHLMLSLE
jgi:hypothetical protein